MRIHEDHETVAELAVAEVKAHERVAAWASILLGSVLALFVLSAATGAGANGSGAPVAPEATATNTATSTATHTATATTTNTAVPPTSTAVPPTSTPVPPNTAVPSSPIQEPTQAPQPPAPTSTPAPPPPSPATAPALEPMGMDAYSRALFDATNARRASVGQPALRENGYLNAIAHMRSADMAANNYFSHTSPITGQNVFDLMDQYGVPYGWAGENLAKNNYPDGQTVQVADQALWDSPTHHENIVNPNFTDVGIALVVDATGMKYFTIVFTD